MRLLSPAMTVGLAAMASRLLGYVRDVLIANTLGAGPTAEALLAALRMPNALRRILGEGGLNAVLTPLYMRLQIRSGDETAAGFARDALAFAALALSILSALLALGAAGAIYLSAPGLKDQPASYQAAQWWFVLMTPFIGTATLASIAGAILNAERRYFVVAMAPAVVNAVLVCAYLIIPGISNDPNFMATLMAGSLSLGGFMQLALTIVPLAPVLRRAAGHLSPESIATIGKALRLGAPALAATASFQVIGIVAAAMASWEPRGLAWFYYADRLFQLPLSLAGVIIGSVVVTELSANRIRQDHPHALSRDDALNLALIFGMAMGLPAAAALFALAEPIIDILFGHGAFSDADVTGTALALMVMAPGLPAGIAARVLLQELLVREETWISACCGAIGVGVAGLAALALAPKWGIGGASAAVTAGLWAQCLAVAGLLVGKGWWQPTTYVARKVLKQSLATAVMVVAVIALRQWLLEGSSHAGTSMRLLHLGLTCTAGAVVYGAMVWFAGGIPQRQRHEAVG